MYSTSIKPAVDFLFALALSVLTAPIIAMACIAVRLESRGAPIFLQKRVGKGGRLFSIYKIRSMRSDAESAGPHFTAANDPRVTRVGRILRATSIDELPQIWNILLGQMSFVGPRPDVPAQKVNYDSQPGSWEKRHSVRPGLTGLAQARFRSAATPEQRLQSDLEYARELSFGLDCRVIWMTFGAVLGRKNVN